VDPHGNVTEIKILKRMGVFGDWPADVTALQTLIRWRAKAGPTRIVDIPWTIIPGRRYITERRIAYSKAVTSCSAFAQRSKHRCSPAAAMLF
jgi:hypothetical protein